MLAEIESDIGESKLYISDRLTSYGRQDFSRLLQEAARSHDEVWLAGQLGADGMFNASLTRCTARGLATVKMPRNANETLAEGEFNRYYLRALCVFALRNNIRRLRIYRAKAVSRPGAEAQALVGKWIDAERLLDALRTNMGDEAVSGLPGGLNSGLSAELI